MNQTKRSVEKIRRVRTLARTLLEELDFAEEYEQVGEIQSEVDFYEEVKRLEIELITRALTHSQGHQAEAARLIRLKPTTLNSKIRRYGIRVNTFSKDVAKRSIPSNRGRFREEFHKGSDQSSREENENAASSWT